MDADAHLHDAQPGHRDAVDVARVLALALVVVGHLTLAVVDREAGEVRGANLLALHPGWAWVAVVAPMPVFFAAGGWANARATVDTAAPRLRTLVGVAAVVVLSWSVAVVVSALATGEPGVVADGARIATQPVWFLAAYVPFAAAGRSLAGAAARSPVAAIGGCLLVLAALDLARFGLGAPEWIGWVGFALAWGVPWLAGGWWRERSTEGFAERRTGLVLLAGASVAAVVLVQAAGYAPALIDAVDGARSNTTPPTLYTALIGLAQVGFLLVVARRLDVAGRRWRHLWDRASNVAVGVYLWHLTALALCASAVALGLPVPERLTPAWWLVRPVWWTAVLVVAAGLVVVTERVGGRRREGFGTPPLPTHRAAVAGVVLTTTAAALVGLRGPRTVPLAVACAVLFVAAWIALGGHRRPSTLVRPPVDGARSARR